MGESDIEIRIDTETKLLLTALRLSPKQLNSLGLSPGDLRIFDETRKTIKAAYKVPKKCNYLTVHSDHNKKYSTVQEYLIDNNYALLRDLLGQGFDNQSIERAVNSKKFSVAHWPNGESFTDVFWSNDKNSTEKLEDLASKVVKFCSKYEITDLISSGKHVGSLQLAIVGLTYAREQGKLLEVSGLDVFSYLIRPKVQRLSKIKKDLIYYIPSQQFL